MPDGRGTLFDVLDRARARGLDVRVLFWRHRLLARFRSESHFAGTEADLRLLRTRNTRWHARWDQAHENDCQHQKCWIVDAGEAGEAVFVGGINLARKSMEPPGHPATPAGSTHDVYVEDQAIAAVEIVERLHAALSRGVDVVFLVPAEPHPDMNAERPKGTSQAFFDSLAALGHHEHFLLAGLVANLPGGGHQAIYVHAKIALVDDGWATIGSANVADRSFYGDTEGNASFWHELTVRTLRVELLREHLGHDTSALDDRTALRLFRERVRANAARWARGEPLDGLAVALDPAHYAS
jgi:phosphatidylserine/phosphatidylglycerophosphate/cardiolipin synthase-like enzyme